MIGGQQLLRAIISASPEIAACRVVEAIGHTPRRLNRIFSGGGPIEVHTHPITVSHGPLEVMAAAFAKKITDDSEWKAAYDAKVPRSRILVMSREIVNDGNHVHLYIGVATDKKDA